MEASRILLFSLSLTILVGFRVASSQTEDFEESLKGFIGQWDQNQRRNLAEETSDEESSSTSNFTTTSVGNDEESRRESADTSSSSSGGNCTRCVPHEDAKTLRLAAIKAQILDKLRLSRPPNISRTALLSIPPVRDYLNSLNTNGNSLMQGDSPSVEPYSRRFDDEYAEDDDEYHINTEKVISLAQNPPESFRIPDEMGSVFFNFAKNLLKYHVDKARLSIRVQERFTFSEDSPAQLYIYQVVRHPAPQNDTSRSTILRSFRTKKVQPSMIKDGWLTIDLRKLVVQWFHRPKENLGVVIHLNDAEGRLFKVYDPEHQEQPVPFVEVHLQTSKRGRKKRSLDLTCGENSKEVRCCRYPLTVDFVEFGWDWVIAPKRYEANYCSGECPYVFLQTYPHTHLTTLVGPQGSTGPCCSSKKLSSISMLYYDPDQGNIVLGMLPNMVVESCGCN